MAISDKDRKILWGRAASKCSLCRCDLVIEPISGKHSVVGDECHIIAQKADGPRGGEVWPDGVDVYTNLILLCKIHHKLIDDESLIYTSEQLRILKITHENWVSLTLKLPIEKKEGKQQVFAQRLKDGVAVVNLIANVDAYNLVNEQPESQEEVDLVGSFFQLVHDYGEMWEDIGPADRVQAEYDIGKELEGLEKNGLLAFGHRSKTYYKIHESTDGDNVALNTAEIHLVKYNNPGLISL